MPEIVNQFLNTSETLSEFLNTEKYIAIFINLSESLGMMFAVIVSEKDPAGLNIKDSLISLFSFKLLEEKFDNSPIYQLTENIKLYTIKNEPINCEGIDKEIEADLFVFATKHQSSAKVNSLSCHVPGNWNKAEFGGTDKKLCIAPADYLKEAFLILNKLGDNLDYDMLRNSCTQSQSFSSGLVQEFLACSKKPRTKVRGFFDISLECTHHGPLISKPAMFIEIGSSKEQWTNKNAGDVIAKTIIELLKKPVKEYKAVIVLGGGHYNHIANKIMIITDYAVGHICPKYMLQYLDMRMLQQAIDKTLGGVTLIILDWKGLGGFKQNVVKLLEDMKIKYKRAKEIIH